jgi:hypothetical protein
MIVAAQRRREKLVVAGAIAAFCVLPIDVYNVFRFLVLARTGFQIGNVLISKSDYSRQ